MLPILLICLFAGCLEPGSLKFPGSQQSELTEESNPSAANGEIAAEVDDFAISIGSAKKLLGKSLPNLVGVENQQALLNVAVNQMIDRHIVYDYLSTQDMAAGENEVRLRLENFKSELTKVDQTIDQFLNKSQQRLDEFEFDMAWRIAWNRYLKRELTDEKLADYFKSHRREFDDSEMRVAHILIKADAGESEEDAYSQARNIHAVLKSGRLGWDEAVKQNSAAPTRDAGGEIGWISYHKPMPAAFSRAAFKLNPGEVSSPVVTPFGVHLIKCMELRAGKTGWRDALNEVRQSAIRDQFRQLARSHRPKVAIRYRAGFSEMQKQTAQ